MNCINGGYENEFIENHPRIRYFIFLLIFGIIIFFIGGLIVAWVNLDYIITIKNKIDLLPKVDSNNKYITLSELTNYANKSELDNYANKSDLINYVQLTDINSKVDSELISKIPILLSIEKSLLDAAQIPTSDLHNLICTQT